MPKYSSLGTEPQRGDRVMLLRYSVADADRNQTQLIDQLRYFPKADHDDGPDALEMVFTLITHHTTFGPRVRSLD